MSNYRHSPQVKENFDRLRTRIMQDMPFDRLEDLSTAELRHLGSALSALGAQVDLALAERTPVQMTDTASVVEIGEDG